MEKNLVVFIIALFFLIIELKEINRKRKTIDLKEIDNYTALGIYCDIKSYDRKTSYNAGQLIDYLRQYIKENKLKLKIDKNDFNKILDIWNRWNINDLKVGTRKQREIVKNIIVKIMRSNVRY